MQPYQLKNLWQQVLIKARDHLSEGACEKWIAPLKPLALEKNVLTLSTADDLHKQWVEERYLSRLEEAIFELSGEHLSVVLKTVKKKSKLKNENELQTTLEMDEKNLPPEKNQIAPADNSTLIRRYTFETFVTGKSNEFAHAAALAISKEPGKTYNPFFIYGGVGLGKTHLINAIGNRIFQTMPTKRILYVSAEQFTNELITAIREHKIGSFKEKYRTVDVLMVDDVQFLSGKDSTQEEFFHTFNDLHNLDKQIILSSDCPPQQVEGIEERLRSRFAWGLCTDIQKPDVETRIAILQKKALLEKILVPTKVIVDIAEKVDSNIRDLEGAFTKVVARASLMNKTFENAFDDLENDDKVALQSNAFIDDNPARTNSDISLRQIVETVAAHFAIAPESLLANTRSLKIVRPRQIAMYLCRAITLESWANIAKFFGKKDHATVMRAYNKIQRETKNNFQLVQLFQKLFPNIFVQ
ncbi:MAG: chromosomal replication initiator protein DnaA [Selenomonadaceae bacterium]|nr:chromosomal replication initiator protein DnaA [Selenomonadaceae bacterium]